MNEPFMCLSEFCLGKKISNSNYAIFLDTLKNKTSPKLSLKRGAAVHTAGSENFPLENGNNIDICGKIDREASVD